jgi:hypothetical protein
MLTTWVVFERRKERGCHGKSLLSSISRLLLDPFMRLPPPVAELHIDEDAASRTSLEIALQEP